MKMTIESAISAQMSANRCARGFPRPYSKSAQERTLIRALGERYNRAQARTTVRAYRGGEPVDRGQAAATFMADTEATR